MNNQTFTCVNATKNLIAKMFKEGIIKEGEALPVVLIVGLQLLIKFRGLQQVVSAFDFDTHQEAIDFMLSYQVKRTTIPARKINAALKDMMLRPEFASGVHSASSEPEAKPAQPEPTPEPVEDMFVDYEVDYEVDEPQPQEDHQEPVQPQPQPEKPKKRGRKKKEEEINFTTHEVRDRYETTIADYMNKLRGKAFVMNKMSTELKEQFNEVIGEGFSFMDLMMNKDCIHIANEEQIAKMTDEEKQANEEKRDKFINIYEPLLIKLLEECDIK